MMTPDKIGLGLNAFAWAFTIALSWAGFDLSTFNWTLATISAAIVGGLLHKWATAQ